MGCPSQQRYQSWLNCSHLGAPAAESFAIRSHKGTPFVILNEQGDPLTDLDGTLILLRTRAEAEEWRRPWERVEVWPRASEGRDDQ
jgi:hypothetical protein